MLGLEPDFLLELAKHSLAWSLLRLDAPLGELPSILTDPSAPEQAILIVDEDYPDVWPKAIGINHVTYRLIAIVAILHNASAARKLPGRRAIT
jgi:hypothetical protein